MLKGNDKSRWKKPRLRRGLNRANTRHQLQGDLSI